jgi:3D-(3,5/4)-trihydroxycyclohexane-1,2-dione acylhydrolase (decyclizing)
VRFAAHAAALGADAVEVGTLDELRTALRAARESDRTCVVVTAVRADDWTPASAFWQVGVPEVSELDGVRQARAALDEGLAAQRRGV